MLKTKVLKFVTLLVVGFVVAFIIVVTTLFMTSKIILVDGKLYMLDESFSLEEESICEAMSPGCGVCASPDGAVLRGDKCYIAS